MISFFQLRHNEHGQTCNREHLMRQGPPPPATRAAIQCANRNHNGTTLVCHEMRSFARRKFGGTYSFYRYLALSPGLDASTPKPRRQARHHPRHLDARSSVTMLRQHIDMGSLPRRLDNSSTPVSAEASHLGFLVFLFGVH